MSPHWENNWEELLIRRGSIPDMPLLQREDQKGPPSPMDRPPCSATRGQSGEAGQGRVTLRGRLRLLTLPPLLVSVSSQPPNCSSLSGASVSPSKSRYLLSLYFLGNLPTISTQVVPGHLEIKTTAIESLICPRRVFLRIPYLDE